ncbi:MAG: CoB--CoM heterodisulfide reductase iron-sulfur subunit B family protein [Rikenellaceae bacterium]|jgi:heterodisulfide reductase subunit B|nr:CoB--CoM heterodisulfide reductase iron-sulfur subunit B family protein [Rikenellaceae bacterium]
MNKLGFYPGCSLEGTSREYAESVLATAELFGVELAQVPDWNCCGATAAHNLNRALSLALPARILAKALDAGMKEIVVPCAACYNRLSVTQHELFLDEKLRRETEEAVGLPLSDKVEILNVVQFVERYIEGQLPEKVTQPFGSDVACYYGCLLVRPHDVLQFDRQEDPQAMDRVMRLLGANPIDWPFKTECCGASLSIGRTELVAKLSGRIVREAEERGAGAIIVGCPMCHSNLDMRRPQINKYLGARSKIPTLYLTQAIALACGLDKKQSGTRRNFVKVDWNALRNS